MSLTDAINTLRLELGRLGVRPPMVTVSHEDLRKIAAAIEAEIGMRLYTSRDTLIMWNGVTFACHDLVE